jgi:anti-sigma factor RsiW
MKHPTKAELLEYEDLSSGTAGDRYIADHLAECSQCRAVHAANRHFREALRLIPPEKTSPVFTPGVLKRLGIPEAPSLWWIFLRNFAPILAAVVIVLTVITVGSMAGGGTDANVQRTLLDYGKMEDAVRVAWGGASGWIADLLKTHLPFVFVKDSSWLTAYLVVLFVGIALLDRYIFGPLLRRRR